MKKLLIILLIALISNQLFAQERVNEPLLRKVEKPLSSILSPEHQSHLKSLKESESYLGVSVIAINPLAKIQNGASFTIDLPGHANTAISSTTILEQRSEYETILQGEVDGGEVLLIQENGRTYGQIRQNEHVFEIQSLDNGYATFLEYNMPYLNQMDCAMEDDSSYVHHSPYDQKDESGGTSARTSGGNPLIRVLVLFTPAARATGMNMNNLANMARGQWLTAQSNSAVQSTLQIAAVQELNFVENINDQDIFEDRENLVNNIQAQQWRDQFEADVVILLTNGNYPGIGGVVADIGPNEGRAYGIVQVANATATFTFIHEVGHLFGARHQIAADPTPGDAHGHDWQRTTGRWFWQKTNRYGSIMRTQQSGRTRVTHFSNPFRTHQGRATGVNGTSHNARVINTNGRIVCDFRINPPAVNIYGTGLANGGDRLTFTSSVSQGRTPYTYRWQADIGRVYTASRSSSLSITMPQNDDLELRLTVTDADGRVNTDTHFTRNSFLNGGGCTICPDSSLFDTVGEEDILSEELPSEMLVYPNPTVNELQIILGNDYESYRKWQIVDLQGKVVLEALIDGDQAESRLISINIQRLSATTYILNLLGTGESRSVRFIKD